MYCVACRAGTTTLFLLGSQPPIDCLKIPALVQSLYKSQKYNKELTSATMVRIILFLQILGPENSFRFSHRECTVLYTNGYANRKSQIRKFAM